jgi:SulP family sulfate permease
LCLSGPLIFGAAQAIHRQQHRLADARILIIDLTGVPHLGVTTSLALESTIREAAENGAEVYLTGLESQPRERLERLGIAGVVPAEHWCQQRSDALRQVLGDTGTPAAVSGV